MKRIVSLTLFLICLVAHSQNIPSGLAKSPRVEKIINSQWVFNYFADEKANAGYEAPGFDDSRWPSVSIPHTWSTFETTGDIHPFIRSASEKDNPYWWTGWGWYRKHFTVNNITANQKVFIEFEGVQKYCKIWLNGKYVGDHKGGYGSFDFDITSFLNPGKDNVLAIAVNNRQDDAFKIPPMAAGNFNVYGGIYRDVTITIKDKLYIPMQGSASHEGGTYITTPGVNQKESLVRVQTWVKNDYQQAKNCQLSSYILDATGKTVQVIKTKATISQGQLYKFDQTFKSIKSPILWSPDNPYVYQVYSEITEGNKVTDSYSSTFGFRWFRWNYKENFLYVNGKKTPLHGGNRHQEYPWLGDAIPKWITLMDLKDIAENLNYNFMRTAHYPNDKIVYDFADRNGIIIDEEVPNIKDQDFSKDVQIQQLREMIRRDRNHPSIMFWSMGNETNKAVDSRFAVEEDSTRIITARKVTGGTAGAFARHSDENLPIENLLRCTIRGWYNKDIKNLEPSDGQQSGTEEHQVNMLRASGLFGTGNLSTWIYADHGADREYVNSPLLHVNPKGYVDVYRVPKYAYYFWQATFGDKPMVFIEPHFWTSRYLGQKKDIVVFSNCDKVELKVNGVTKGTQTLSQANFHTAVFKEILIENGTITATATKGDKSANTQIILAGEPAKIALTASHLNIGADKGTVVIIKADIVDAKGNHIYGATNPLRWSVTGPATLAGPHNYESDVKKNQYMEGVWYIDAPVSNVIRSNGKPGKIRVLVSASGLASGSVEITAEEIKGDNTFISEPVLNDEGRGNVTRFTLVSERLEEIPQEVKEISSDISLNTSDLIGYSRLMRETILKNNPGVDTASIEFRAMIKLFALHLVNNSGKLSADDFNFNINHFNNCRLIASYINATKLPPLFKETLRGYYSDLVIRQGVEKNAGDEMNWMNWIPSGGTVIVSQDGNVPTWPKGTVITNKTNLPDLIATVYPVFAKYSAEARERALIFVGKMNPYVKQVLSGEGDNITITYTAEKGRPVLIPLIKFISE